MGKVYGKLLWKSPGRHKGRVVPSIAALVVAAVGVIVLFQASAGTPFISAEPESGTLAAGAVQVSDTAASASRAVRFGSVSTTPPPPTPPPSTGTVLFDADVARKGLSAYAGVIHGERITIVNDPVLGAARKVMKFTVLDSDIGPTENPRAQVETAKQFGEGADIYIGWSMLFPSDWPTTLPSGGWMTFSEVYGPPYNGGSPVRIGAQNSSTAPAMSLGNGSVVPWRATSSVQKNRWYDFVLREKLSTSSSTGIVELWMNTGSGWQKQTLSGKQQLNLATLGPANSGGPNYHKLALYRMKGMYNSVTLYMGEHRIGTTFDAAAPKSY